MVLMISMKRIPLWLWCLLVILIGLIAGKWLGQWAADPPETKAQSTPKTPRVQRETPAYAHKVGERPEAKSPRDQEALDRGALAGQRTVRFGSADELAAFLRDIDGRSIVVLGKIPGLNTLRIGFRDPSVLDDLLGDNANLDYIFPSFIPNQGTVQDGAVGFGNRFLEWLGAPQDRSGLGANLKIAVLDTGIGNNRQFTNAIQSVNLIDLPENLSDMNGHGTAVASLIASQLGLAPDADLFSFRIADDNGISDTFLIAQAITMAAEQGVDLINVSLGSHTGSLVLEDAVNFATERGLLIIASSGNDGINQVVYPAAYDGVASIGSVDARGTLLDFSNRGDVDLTAPGLDLTSAWPDDQLVSFTGTSASAPIATGAIAAVMSSENVTAQRALELIVAHANEAGAPGADPGFGEGMIDLGRIARRNQPDFADLALASNHINVENGRATLQVTVENRGNTQTINSPVEVTTPHGTQQLNVVGLGPGDIHTFNLPLALGDQPVEIRSRVQLTDGGADSIPSNNSRTDVFTPESAP